MQLPIIDLKIWCNILPEIFAGCCAGAEFSEVFARSHEFIAVQDLFAGRAASLPTIKLAIHFVKGNIVELSCYFKYTFLSGHAIKLRPIQTIDPAHKSRMSEYTRMN